MRKSSRFSPEVIEHAMDTVFKSHGQHEWQWGAI